MVRAAGIAVLVATAAWLPGSGTAAPPPEPLRVTVVHGGIVQDVATAVPAGDGRALTVAHPLRGGGRVEVAGEPARVVARDARLDLAVLAVPGLRGGPLRLADGGSDGEVAVLRDGRVRSLPARVERRAAARVRRPGGVDRRPVLELAVSIAAGDSGAAVTDEDGRVLGIVFARSSARPGVAWALDASALRSVLERGRPARP